MIPLEPLGKSNETVSELRRKLRDYAHNCPYGKKHRDCPFRVFSVLSYGSACSMIAGMSHDACLSFFELELRCRVDAELGLPASNVSPA